MAAQKEQKQKQVTDEEIFASCSFSSLGLQPSLCDQLRGSFLFVQAFKFFVLITIPSIRVGLMFFKFVVDREVGL